MKHSTFSAFLLVLSCANALAQNVMISNTNRPNEPAILINSTSPNNIVAGANLNNTYRSTDTGRTWSAAIASSTHGVWGDPSFSVDTAGNFYFFHLSNPPTGSWVDRIVCQKSTDKGETWTNGSFAGLNGTKVQDKEWSVVDPRNNNIYLTWTQFDKYNSNAPKDSSVILFSKSEDAGASWSTPMRINKIAGDCIDSDNTVEGAVPAVGPNGEIYVSWAGPNGLVFNKSLDEGKTWLRHETAIDPMPTGWDYYIPGLYRANGLPITLCDLSNGPNRGTIYVNWSDQRNGSDNTDVFIAKSIDGGDTWSQALKVNDDTTERHQFLTWMDIDQVTGYIYCVFYDRRNYTTDSTDVVLAMSKDGGASFRNFKISESPFLPFNTIFFGDYNNISVHNGIIRPIWTRMHNGNLSVWTHLINQEQLETILGIESFQVDKKFQFENFPNPSFDYQYVSFKLRSTSSISLKLINNTGKTIANIIDNERRGTGKYIERIDFDKLDLASGSYSIILRIDQKIVVNRLVKF